MINITNAIVLASLLATNVPHAKGMYVHIGDCGFDRYPVPESGAAGYCYIDKANKATITITVTPSHHVTVQPVSAVIVVSTAPTVDAVSTPEAQENKPKHCNKGEGNGSEGCDPGNHPELGNDDENNTTPKEDHKP